jgi:hypothetical protein
MSTETFYATASALCFTLLGFWWIVVQFRHREFTRSRGARRMAFVVSLHFILPGLVSLAALLAFDATYLWRIAFGLAGVTGLAAVGIGARSVAEPAGAMVLIRNGEWVTAPLYAALTLVALFPEALRSATGLEPLQVEGLILVAILLLGLVFAWALFTDPDWEAE